MHNNNNNKNNNDNHILTPTERAFYQRLATEGTQKIVQIAEILEHETTV